MRAIPALAWAVDGPQLAVSKSKETPHDCFFLSEGRAVAKFSFLQPIVKIRLTAIIQHPSFFFVCAQLLTNSTSEFPLALPALDGVSLRQL